MNFSVWKNTKLKNDLKLLEIEFLTAHVYLLLVSQTTPLGLARDKIIITNCTIQFVLRLENYVHCSNHGFGMLVVCDYPYVLY